MQIFEEQMGSRKYWKEGTLLLQVTVLEEARTVPMKASF